MLVPGDLGFSNLVLAVLSLLIPLFALVVRQRWNLSVTRNEEIRQLLELASEEAARAEIERLEGWHNVPVPVGSGAGLGSGGNYYYCAVCYSPTTTRCARCKAVRYCSGKCQIVHWRQGHKEECHPPEGRSDCNGNLSRSDKICSGQIENPRENPYDDPIEFLTNQGALAKSSSPSVLAEERNSAESRAENCSSEFSSSSFSGFSSSITSSESSDDSSVCESIGSDDSVKSDVPLSADVTHGASQSTRSLKIVDKDEGCSPKFSVLVDAVESFKDSGKLGHSKGSNDGHVLNCLSRQSSLHKNGMERPAIQTFDFWGPNLDSNKQGKHMHDCSSNISTGGAGGSATSDSKTVFRFSFSLSEDTSGPFHKEDLKDTSTRLPNYSDTTRKISCSSDAASVRDKLSRNISDKGPGGLHYSRSRGIESMSSRSRNTNVASSFEPSTSKMDASNLPSSSSKIHVTGVSNTVSHKAKLGEARLTASTMGSHNAPNRHSDSRLKPGKANEGHNSATISPQVIGRLPSAKSGLKTSVWRVLDQFKGSVLAKHNRAGIGSDMSERCNVKALLSYESFVKLYSWKGLELQPCGLINCGNSCYANVVLQCLAFTPPLTAYFLQGLHSEACARRDWCFTCEFERLIQKFKEGKSPVSPIGIVSHLKNIGSQLGNGREEDAHEFLRCAIDKMQSDFLMANGKKAAGSKEEDMTLIGLTFGGYLRSKIRCLRCNGKTERRERLMDLTVEIEGDIETLEEALRRFTGSETLDGENKYQCSRCKTYEKARKKLTVLEAPNILTIAFKRFQSGKFGKLNKAIRYSEIIDLASFIDGWKNGPAAYRLYGVIVHLDIMNAAFSGHYVCYVRNTQDRWFKIDDSTVKPVELERVLTKGAYMLLYARCSPQGPRLIRDKSSHHDPKHFSAKSSKVKTTRDFHPSSMYSNDLMNTDYSRFHRPLSRRDDSSSDASSLFSSNSDESSYSTNSTQDSSSYDDLSDYIFGELGGSWTSSPWSNSSNSDTSSYVFSR